MLFIGSIGFGLAICEFFLDYRMKKVRKHSMDPGLMQHDRILGWKLSSGWDGKHRHHDFNVRYKINSMGFRQSSAYDAKGKRKVAMVGDSFTFGQGVNDQETFIERINMDSELDYTCFNFAIPGYSTDQELLLIQKNILRFSPEFILVVVFLGNDLFDNRLRFPLQANNAKPFYDLVDSKLFLRNVPVPVKYKTPQHQLEGMIKVGLLPEQSQSRFAAFLERSELYKLGRDFYTQAKNKGSVVSNESFSESSQLFFALVDQIKETCRQNNIHLGLILMPSRKYVEAPGSFQASYQEYFRKEILTWSRTIQLNTIDLASHLKAYYLKTNAKIFYSFEGHLTAEGNKITAEFLKQKINDWVVASD